MPAPLHFSRAFRTEVHGSVFADRATVLPRLSMGDTLILVPDPPGVDEPAVWVHARGGDVIGHLPPRTARWLAPWMLAGGRCRAVVTVVGGAEVPSWRRLVIEVVPVTARG